MDFNFDLNKSRHRFLERNKKNRLLEHRQRHITFGYGDVEIETSSLHALHTTLAYYVRHEMLIWMTLFVHTHAHLSGLTCNYGATVRYK